MHPFIEQALIQQDMASLWEQEVRRLPSHGCTHEHACGVDLTEQPFPGGLGHVESVGTLRRGPGVAAGGARAGGSQHPREPETRAAPQ